MVHISSKNDIISSVKINIDDAISQVKGLLKANVSQWGGFILAACIIDYLAGYRYKGIIIGNKKQYKRFIKDYLKPLDTRYDENFMYEHLRCGLVHSYSDTYMGKRIFLFTHLLPKEHLKTKVQRDIEGNILDTRIILSLPVFMEHIEIVSKKLFKQAETSTKILESMKLRLDEVGVKRSDFKITTRVGRSI